MGNSLASPSQSSAATPTTPPPKQIGDLVKTTQYGWKGDVNPTKDNPTGQDHLTNDLHLGFLNNPLTPHAAALTDSEARNLNAQPGDVIDVGGQKYYYADRAPESDDRVDLYQPSGFNKNIPDFQAIRNLGGGSAKLKGGALSTAGEANVQRLMNGQTPPAQPTQQATIQPLNRPQASVMPIDSARASNNNQGIAFANLLKRVQLASTNGNKPDQS